jgi:hypothetical protein
MRKILMTLFAMAMFSACEPECPECPDPTLEEIITELAERGHVVDAKVKYNELLIDGEFFGIYDDMEITVKKDPLLVCDPFGWGPEYDWLCTMTGSKGRALGRQPVVDPEFTDVFLYTETGSLEQPLDMTSTMYFSAKPEHYPNYIDTNANPQAFFGLTVAKWGIDWEDALNDWCDISNPDSCLAP